ncbi:hypothetical protein O6R08_00025 [Cutibacterium equinum]|uniref:Lipoprotein n=1 Tax=Cutibacterium equinum TaxID=3016342 RepID=A0ABY7QY90_9ACTN|nr:hypothetical protein [Cutibacterium equinum]WCC80002.1 hypothetical protein O6R08_00025 [Cutibacterium equinum]
MRRSVVTCALLSCVLISGCSTLKPLTNPQPTPTSSASSPEVGADAYPAWAVPVTRSGKKLGSFGDDRIRIEVEQVAIAKAPKDSVMVDPDDGTPVVRKGSPIVLVRYIVTNVSEAPINLGLGTVTITARYPDWSWRQPLVSVPAPEADDTHKVATTPFAPGNARPPYVLGPGESFMVGANYPYEVAEQLDVTATVVVCDSSGAVDPGLGWTVSGQVHLT